jgi:amino acid transporter
LHVHKVKESQVSTVQAPEGHSVAAEETLKREFTLWSAFTFAFAFISPIVCLYAIFGIALQAAGPASWLAFIAVFAGQILVACVLAECASKWPLEGSVYQWSRKLAGSAYGWFTGWAYMWTLAIAMAAVAYGAAGFVPAVLGSDPFSTSTQFLVALGFVILATLANTAGRTFMKILLACSIGAEVIGSVGLGTYLLIFHNENPLSVVTQSAGAAEGSVYLWAGFAGAMAFIGWGFVGFESAGAISEEVKEPRRDVPKAIIFSLCAVSAVVIYSALAITLAIPNIGAVMAGEVADPVADTITAQLGSGVARPLFAMFIIGFMASLLALQASCSRVMYAFARDRAIPAAGFLSKLSSKDRVPSNAIIVAGVVASLVMIAAYSDNIYVTLLSFTTGGFYIAFAMPVLAAVRARMTGQWTPGTFSLGKAAGPVTVAAAVWLVFEVVNIAWPRASDLPWYQNWGVVVMIAVVGVLGAFAYAAQRTHIQHNEGDAHADPAEAGAPV